MSTIRQFAGSFMGQRVPRRTNGMMVVRNGELVSTRVIDAERKLAEEKRRLSQIITKNLTCDSAPRKIKTGADINEINKEYWKSK